MAEGPGHEVPLKRRRDGQTDYGNRLELLKSGDHRAVIRVSNNHTRVQLVRYGDDGDTTAVAAFSGDLAGYGWDGHTGNLAAAYLTGLLAGRRALADGIDRAVPDLGVRDQEYGGRHYAAVRGLRDAGLDVPADETALPAEDRVNGEHMDDGGAAAVDEVKKNIAEEYGEA
ncbi:MAG: 50S ribosomal protein L18 [Candidatus Nanohaloarchaea archaeon]|nr:50S ribosomal protein L18 [Candidatus Nanohaloarchaea archaeon]